MERRRRSDGGTTTAGGGGGSDGGQCVSVLVVDDSAVERAILAHGLESAGFVVDVAADGASCTAALDGGGEYDVMLLDINMPDMDGFALLQRIRAHPRLRHMPVVMMSADPAEPRVVRSIEMGAADFLPKPFTLPAVRARLLQVVGARGGGAARAPDCGVPATDASSELSCRLRVLVVDDSHAVLKLLSKTLGQAGYAVSVADSGEAALELLAAATAATASTTAPTGSDSDVSGGGGGGGETGCGGSGSGVSMAPTSPPLAPVRAAAAVPSSRGRSGSGGSTITTSAPAAATAPAFDVVLLDAILPGMPGTEVLQRLRAGPPAWRACAVIVMTSLDDAAMVKECLALGADDVLLKPLIPEVVKTRINARLEHNRLRSWVERKLPILASTVSTPAPAAVSEPAARCSPHLPPLSPPVPPAPPVSLRAPFSLADTTAAAVAAVSAATGGGSLPLLGSPPSPQFQYYPAPHDCSPLGSSSTSASGGGGGSDDDALPSVHPPERAAAAPAPPPRTSPPVRWDQRRSASPCTASPATAADGMPGASPPRRPPRPPPATGVYSAVEVAALVAAARAEGEAAAAAALDVMNRRADARVRAAEGIIRDLQRSLRQVSAENRSLRTQVVQAYDRERELTQGVRAAEARIRRLLREAAEHGYVPAFYTPPPRRQLQPTPVAADVPPTYELVLEDPEDERTVLKALALFEAAAAEEGTSSPPHALGVRLNLRVQHVTAHGGVRSCVSRHNLPTHALPLASPHFAALTRDVCDFPPYFAPLLHSRLAAHGSGAAAATAATGAAGGEPAVCALDFVRYWAAGHDDAAVRAAAHTRVSRFWQLACAPRATALDAADLGALVTALVDYHPELVAFRANPALRAAYTAYVVASIFASLHGQRASAITAAEVAASNLVDAFYLVTSQPTRNVLPFSVAAFDEAWGAFTRLAGGVAPAMDTLPHVPLAALRARSDGVVSPFVVDRILDGAPRRLAACKAGDGAPAMTFHDFVWYWLAEKDRMLDTSLPYWFRCLDVDDDGYLSVADLLHAYNAKGAVVAARRSRRGSPGALPFTPAVLGDLARPLMRGTPPRPPAASAAGVCGAPPAAAVYDPELDATCRPFRSTAGASRASTPPAAPRRLPAALPSAPATGAAALLQRSPAPAPMPPVAPARAATEGAYAVISSLLDFINPALPGRVSPLDIRRAGAGPVLFDVLISLSAPMRASAPPPE